MPKTTSSVMDDSRESGTGASEKDSEEVSRESTTSPRCSSSFSIIRRQQLGKYSFKSLTALSVKDSLENLQKIRRRSDGSRRIFFSRGSSSGGSEKRGRKKYSRKRFDKPNVSEFNIRKVTHELTGDEKEKLVSVVSKKKLGKSTQSSDASKPNTVADQLDENANIENNNSISDKDSPREILQHLEKLRLGGEASSDFKASIIAQNPEEAKSVIDYGSGDVRQDFSLDLNLGLSDEKFAGMACAQIFDSKRRSVQWKHEVDVIYYAGDADGEKIVRRENEPLREEAEQQARRNRFIKLALTKNLLSNVSVCQLRDPWLVVLPK